jgi:hypothetical protein
MAVRKHYKSDEAYNLACRVDRALGALDYVLNNFTPKPRRKGKQKAPRRLPPRPAVLTPPNLTSPNRLVLDAMAAAFALVAHDLDALGELTYYQIKSATSLSDDRLGLALSSLIPRYLCTRSDGDERIYFLPRLIRRQLKACPLKDDLRRVA